MIPMGSFCKQIATFRWLWTVAIRPAKFAKRCGASCISSAIML
jgi:hypothetical protein